MNRKIIIIFILLAIISSIFAKEYLTLGVMPFLSREEIQRRYTPLADYISKAIGKPVLVSRSDDYDRHVDAVGHDDIDIGYMGSTPYVILTEKHGKKRLIARLKVNNGDFLEGKIIVSENSEIDSLPQLGKGIFAYVDKGSTMGYLVPYYMFINAGIDKEIHKKEHMTGNQDNVALGVLTGDYEVGAVKLQVFNKYKDKGLKAIADQPKITQHCFIASNKMDDELFVKIQKVFLYMHKTEEGKKVLKVLNKRLEKFVEVKDSEYDGLRDMMEVVKDAGYWK